MNAYRMSNLGKDLIKHFEGFRAEAYLCPAKVWTIGYGTTRGVKKGQKITESKATQMMAEDLVVFENAVKRMVTVPLTQNQFDALVSFTYNLGATAVAGSTLLKLLNARQYHLVPEQMRRWNKAGGKVQAGLVRRRNAEAHLWINGVNRFYF